MIDGSFFLFAFENKNVIRDSSRHKFVLVRYDRTAAFDNNFVSALFTGSASDSAAVCNDKGDAVTVEGVTVRCSRCRVVRYRLILDDRFRRHRRIRRRDASARYPQRDDKRKGEQGAERPPMDILRFQLFA